MGLVFHRISSSEPRATGWANSWSVALPAAVTGSVVVFALVDRLRPHPDRLLADTTATAAGLVVAMAVFTVGSRVRRRA
ncbi:hypothetical protein [Streptomyces sp. JNUCC 63]